MNRKRIAVIGGGYSGVSLSINLQRQAKETPLEILLFGTPEEFTLGKAYSTMNPSHVLNVQAHDMSMFADDPAHFVNWLKEHHETKLYLNPEESVETQYVPRMLYGRYLQSQIAIAKTDTISPAQIQLIPKEIIDLTDGKEKLELTTTDGEKYHVDLAVLATGNAPPRNIFPKLVHPYYFPNPWNYHEVEKIPRDSNVLIVGTGLTMIDVCLTLQDRSHKGKIHAFSPKGLLPQTHAPSPVPCEISLETLPSTVLKRFKYFKTKIKELESKGGNWRGLMNGCRPIVQKLWQTLPHEEKRRFLRHAVLYWDTHRHRIAPSIAHRLNAMQASEHLTIHKAWVRTLKTDKDHLVATINPRGDKKSYQLDVDAVVNCCGPNPNLKMVDLPLYTRLFTSGLVTGDTFKMGLAVDAKYACLDTHNTPSKRLFAMGPLCKGTLWEIVAIPDLRVQSFELAKTLLSRCGGTQ